MTTELATSQTLFGGTMMSPVVDPYSVYRRLRNEHPVIPVNSSFGLNYLVTRYDDVVTILKNGALFSSRANARGIGIVMGRTILEMEGKEHVRHRNIIAPFFSPRAMKAEMPEIVQGIADALINQFAPDGRADLVRQFTFTFPMEVITRIIGIPVEDHAAFHRMAIDLISIGDDPPRGFAAAQALVRLQILERRRQTQWILSLEPIQLKERSCSIGLTATR